MTFNFLFINRTVMNCLSSTSDSSSWWDRRSYENMKTSFTVFKIIHRAQLLTEMCLCNIMADEHALVYLFLSVCLHLIVFLWVNTCVNKLSLRHNKVSQMNWVSRRYVLGLMSSKQKHTRATFLRRCFRFAWSTSGRKQTHHMFRMPCQWFSSINMEERAEVARMLKYVPEPFRMLWLLSRYCDWWSKYSTFFH